MHTPTLDPQCTNKRESQYRPVKWRGKNAVCTETQQLSCCQATIAKKGKTKRQKNQPNKKKPKQKKVKRRRGKTEKEQEKKQKQNQKQTLGIKKVKSNRNKNPKAIEFF